MTGTSKDKLAFSGVDDAAAAFALKPWHVRRAINEHLLPTRRIGARTIILAADIVRWIEASPPQHSRRKANAND